MSDTPQTDAAQKSVRPAGNDSGPPHEQYVYADFARELERENAELRKDKALLDSGCIVLTALGKRIEFVGLDIRKAIRTAIDSAKGGAK